MKRINTVLLVLISLLFGGVIRGALASDYFGELNVKAGLNLTSLKRIEWARGSVRLADAEKLNPCISFCGEYLIPVKYLAPNLNFLKCGLGIKYLLPSKFKIKNESFPELKFSYLPIYFILQAHPFIKSDSEVLRGIFIKGDIGYNAYFNQNIKQIDEFLQFKKSKGGLYYAFGAGYEFPYGLLFEVTYSIYKSSIETLPLKEKRVVEGDCSYSCVGLNVGYKFKI